MSPLELQVFSYYPRKICYKRMTLALSLCPVVCNNALKPPEDSGLREILDCMFDINSNSDHMSADKFQYGKGKNGS